jgi:C4-dicarboxylate transporter DctM subunit
MSSTVVLFGTLAIFIFINIPISVSLGLSSAITLLYIGMPVTAMPSILQATVQKFSLLTIPLFVLAGVIMDKGGISKRLINMANSLIGPIHGGLGDVSVVTAMYFAAISVPAPRQWRQSVPF